MTKLLRCLLLFTASIFFSENSHAQKLALNSFVTGLSMPMDVKNCGDNRVFIAERAGRIRVVNGAGTLLATPMLDITSKVSSVSCEEGFLGIAFSARHKTDRKLYVNYTANISGQLHTIIEEYKVSATDSNVVDPSSALELLRVVQPFCNHNGGNMMIGKDSMLYIFLGDGGSANDPSGNGQSKFTFLGKILRIDIRNSSIAQPYVIPPSNPFYNDNTTGIKKEIWAYGLRNPFRGSTDRITGDIWIGDVGQGTREEIDFQPYSSPGGVNYGWKIMEGTFCFSPSSGCPTAGLQLPIQDYPRTNGYSVTGGYVHRSAQSKYLFSMYLFSDYGFRWIDGFRQSGGAISGSVERLIPGASVPAGPVGFGEDYYGDLYVCLFNHSTVYKMTDTSYLRRPKAYILSATPTGVNYLLKGLQGRTTTYQWLKNGTPVPAATTPDFTTTGDGIYQLELTNELNRKDTSDPFSLTILSLSFLDFDAKRNASKDVELKWKTTNENNVKGFEIERRRAGENDFSTLGFVASTGSSTSENIYDYPDQNNYRNEKLYYRLKIVQRDNSFSYSPIRSVGAGSGKGYTLYPNPASGQAMLDLDGVSFPVKMNIYDAKGRLVSSKLVNQSQYFIDLQMMKGIYFVELFDKEEKLGRQKLFVR